MSVKNVNSPYLLTVTYFHPVCHKCDRYCVATHNTFFKFVYWNWRLLYQSVNLFIKDFHAQTKGHHIHMTSLLYYMHHFVKKKKIFMTCNISPKHKNFMVNNQVDKGDHKINFEVNKNWNRIWTYLSALPVLWTSRSYKGSNSIQQYKCKLIFVI
jgi:hypothetical protein